MISRRTFIAAPVAASVLGCRRPQANNTPLWNTASGFAVFDGQRMEVRDGFVTLEYEPLEWKRYNFCVRMVPSPLTEQERATVRTGKEYWLDKPHPPTPEVRIEVGPWSFGQRPALLHEIKPSIHFCRFLSTWDINFSASLQEVKVSSVGAYFSVDVVSKGKRTVQFHRDKRHCHWDLTFTGTAYDDAWMMEPEAATRDY